LLSLIAAAPLLGFVLPSERVLLQLEERRARAKPLHIEADLAGDPRGVQAWAPRVVFELHPEFGARVSDSYGGRWLVRGRRVVASNRELVPDWIPALEILVLRSAEELQEWLDWARVDGQINQLGRCGEADCFVLGGRAATRQLWIDKDRFEILRWVAGSGRRIEFAQYANWGSVRFPSEIRVVERDENFAVFSVTAVRPISGLAEADFGPDWAQRPNSLQ
jgi:hypothetical protein